MLEAVKQRLKSKTYIAAVVMSILTVLELNMHLITGLIPGTYSKYLVLVWAPLMLTLREVTTAAISEK